MICHCRDFLTGLCCNTIISCFSTFYRSLLHFEIYKFLIYYVTYNLADTDLYGPKWENNIQFNPKQPSCKRKCATLKLLWKKMWNQVGAKKWLWWYANDKIFINNGSGKFGTWGHTLWAVMIRFHYINVNAYCEVGKLPSLNVCCNQLLMFKSLQHLQFCKAALQLI